ncbi:hypothetical protein, partial [Thermomonas hydrothermalis]
MSDQKKTPQALIPTSSSLPTVAGEQTGGGILQRMTQGALQVWRTRQALAQPRHRVGEYELCEPDYQQLLLWADRLDLEPEEVLARLSAARAEAFLDTEESLCLVVREGHFLQIVWDGQALPLQAFEWLPGLQLETLAVIRAMPRWPAEQKLPSLRRLQVSSLALASLDLTPVPGLTKLDCSENQLTELDLTPVP